MRRILFQLSIAGVLLSGASATAGITVRQNVAPGATSWPGTPIIATVSNPASQATSYENFANWITSNGQTFTIPVGTNYVLETISLYAGSGSGTSTAGPVMLNLYDIGVQTAPNPQTCTASGNLLGSGNGLAITYTSQATGVLQFDFTDSDRVILVAGHMYFLEISSNNGTQPVRWNRSSSDTYAGGTAYRNRTWLSTTNVNDFALAVYGTATTAQPPSPQCTVNAGVTYQQIDGFGGGAVFLDAGLDPLTDTQMDALYGTDPGQCGLTLIRVRIAPDGNFTTSVTDGQKVYQRGGRILATPWTPPAAMKDNNSLINGGALLPAQYANYAAYLNSFATAMANGGAPLTVISVQNEPDMNTSYESCLWTAAQFLTFFRQNAATITVPVMMPESLRCDPTLSNATLNDPVAVAKVAYVGGHLYGVTVADYPLAHSLGKHTWMTEYLENDQTVGSAIVTAQQIHECLTVANMSAYIWWKLIGNANGLLNAAGVPQTRSYVMAQFSRFIRPGDFRIDVSGNNSSLSVSAFKDPAASRFAIVAVNNTTSPITQTFNLQGITAASIIPWRTSATDSLAQQAPVTVTGNAFTYTIPATAMVTFAGTVPSDTRLAALSVRTVSAPGDNVLIVGFGVTGADTTPKSMVLRGVGPGLAQYGLTNLLTDPVLRVYSGANLIGQNDDWDAATLRPTFVRLYLDNLTPGSRDAALQASFATGGYTVQVGAKTQETGVALAEVYESDASNGRLAALSARAAAGAGDQTLIGGFSIGGTGSKRVLIRGLGPALAGFAVPGFLADPKIVLYSGSNIIQYNDNWVDTPDMRGMFASLYLTPLATGSRDAAMVAQLPPGTYTVQLTGVNGTTGVALIEIYELP